VARTSEQNAASSRKVVTKITTCVATTLKLMPRSSSKPPDARSEGIID
jgi:hypothetical protein